MQQKSCGRFQITYYKQNSTGYVGVLRTKPLCGHKNMYLSIRLSEVSQYILEEEYMCLEARGKHSQTVPHLEGSVQTLNLCKTISLLEKGHHNYTSQLHTL